jgi:chorismate-pyruvate lyase
VGLLEALCGLFYEQPARLATFAPVEANEMPLPERTLLAHDDHMTVSMELFHNGPVALEVVTVHETATHYSRQILLRRSGDGAPVQFGVMRISLATVGEAVQKAIRARSQPLGRVLIEQNVLRKVHMVALYRVTAGPVLADLLGAVPGDGTWGRTAMISVDRAPAIELLEIIAPRAAARPAMKLG